MLSVKRGGIKYHFWVFGMTRLGIEPRSPGPLACTLTITPMSGFKVKLATVVDGDQKVSFSRATTPRCRGGATPGLLHFILDPYLIMLRVKQGGIKYHFSVFGLTRPEIEPRSPGPLVNTLTTTPMSSFKVKLAIVPFSIATTPKYGGRFSFPWIAPLYLWSIPYIAEC